MPELASLLPMVLLLVVIGGFAGVVAGMLGVGGGIVLVPAFFYAFTALGYASPQLMQICVATSLATIVITSPRSVMAHNKKGAVDWAFLRGGAPFVVDGALAGLYMAFGKSAWQLGQAMPAQPVRGAMRAILAYFSTMMGIGSGTFGVPLMTLYGVPIHRAVGTAAGIGLLFALPVVAGFVFLDVAETPPFTLGAVNLPAFAVVIGSTMLTPPLRARLAHSMDPKPLKRAFAVFLTLVALNMLRKVLWG